MATNALGLCFLVLWTSGLVKTIYLGNGWNEKISPWNVRWRYSKRLPHFDTDDWMHNHFSQLKHIHDSFHYNFDINNFFSNLESETSRRQILHKVFYKSKFPNDHKEAFIQTVTGLNLKPDDISITTSSDFPAYKSPEPPESKTRDSKHSNVNSNAARDKNSMMYIATEPPENNVKLNTGSDYHTPSQLELNVRSRDSENVTNSKISKSGHEITLPMTIFSSATSQSTVEKNEINESNPTNLNPEANSLSTEYSTVTDAQKISPTVETQNATENFSTTENFVGNDTGEITSATDLDANSLPDVKMVSTDRITASTPEENPASSDITSDNSVSQAKTIFEVIQTGESILTSYSTEEQKLRPTSYPTTVASKTESIVTSSTDEITEAISSTLGFIESKSTRRGFITETISHDHVIQIPSIKTARVIVSVVFIVIALVAVAVIAIYIFRVKRRAVQYDQLMLLP